MHLLKNQSLSFMPLMAAMALVVPATANTAPIDTALSVVLDGSGSISSSDFSTQQTAYANVLGDTSIFPNNGSVAVNVVQFSSEGSGTIEQSALRIDSPTKRNTLVNSINNMTQIGGATDIQEGISLGVNDMDGFLSGITDRTPGFRKIVDVSTDGLHNQPGDPATESQNAVNNLGYAAVNCLGIGSGADCGFNDGVGSDFSANSFSQLQPVLDEKVRQELNGENGEVPTPTPLALMGIGLGAMGIMRRRSAR